jgi:hypothetical protein
MRSLVGVVLALATLVNADSNRYSGSLPTPETLNTPETRDSWGPYDINTNYYEITPDTGRTVEVVPQFVVS